MKIVHLSDLHIRLYKRFAEYQQIFVEIFKKVEAEHPDIIVFTGDLSHAKTILSGESVKLATQFLVGLSNIAPLYLIIGNHDTSKNSNRLDAVSPIVEAIGSDRIHLLKYSGETPINDQFTFVTYSILDEDRWAKPSDDSKINIGLYHGPISGCVTDSGFTMTSVEHSLSDFPGIDYLLLGDIHKTNQILDHSGRFRFAGSCIQQSHGESNDKGFLVWDIQDKDNFSVKHVAIKNPKPFHTIELNGEILPIKLKIPVNARLRVVSKNDITLDTMRKLTDVLKHKFKLESLSFQIIAAVKENLIDQGVISEEENLRDIEVQERLIRAYLKDFNASSEIMKRVLELNRKYNSVVESEDDIIRGVHWSVKSSEWDNLFNYCEGNRIDFENLNGITGLFGQNMSGKSSAIISMIYTVFNNIPKNNRKSVNIVNQNKPFGSGKVILTINGQDYVIERRTEKYLKKLHGEESVEGKTSVEFCKIEGDSLNGQDRNETDKNIRRLLGTMDDFLLTSMADQHGALAYIFEGSTKRKEILSRFLDLQMFDRKFELAKEDSVDIKAALKKLEGVDFIQKIRQLNKQKENNETAIAKHEASLAEMKQKLSSMTQSISDKKALIAASDIEIVDIEQVNKDLKELLEKKSTYEREQSSLLTVVSKLEETKTKIEKFLMEFPVSEYRKKDADIKRISEQINNIQSDIQKNEMTVEAEKKKLELLKEVPCGPEYSHCKFIKDAYAAKVKLIELESQIKESNRKKEDRQGELNELNPEEVSEYVEKYENILEKQSSTISELSDNNTKLARFEVVMLDLNAKIEQNENLKKQYEANEVSIREISRLKRELDDEFMSRVSFEGFVRMSEETSKDLYKTHGSLEQELHSTEDKKSELEQLRNEYSAYDLFMRCMHTNGISYDIIRKRLPNINREISKVLANIVDFEVFFEGDSNKLDIYIKHPSFEPRLLEMGSGAEKTLAAMAIRIALINVSSLPKSDIFILDEPGTSLDEENLEGFTRMLEMIKSNFSTVILISHLESLKDCVDQQITIEKKGKYAFINC